MKQVQADNMLAIAGIILKEALPLLPEGHIRSVLETWDLQYSLWSVGAAVWDTFFSSLQEAVYSPFFGKDGFKGKTMEGFLN